MFRKIFAAAVVALAIVGFATPADAQQRQGRGMGPNLDEQMAELTELLELDDEQATAVRAVFELQRERMRELRQSAAGDRESMRAAMMEMQEEANLQLAEILSEEQMGKYREYLAERRQGRRPPF